MTIKARLTLFSLSTTLLVGGIFVWWTVASSLREMRSELLQEAQLLAQVMTEESDCIGILSKMPAESLNPYYLRLNRQLAALRSEYQECRSIHLLGRHDDGVYYCMADGLQQGDANFSPPGRICDEALPEYGRALDSKLVSVLGLRILHQEILVTTIAPVLSPSGGAVVAALSFENAAGKRLWHLARIILIPVLFTLTLAGVVLIFGFLQSQPRRWPHQEAVAIATFGLILTLFVATLARSEEQRRLSSAFLQLAQSQAARIAGTLDTLHDRELESLARFAEGRTHVSADDFGQFASFLSKNTAVQAWEWIPAITSGDRPLFEQNLRDTGTPNFEIWQKDQLGNRVPASGRPVFYPVLYVEPVDGNMPALCYDLGSEPLRQAALEEARDTGLVTATEPVTLVQEKERQQGMLIFHPVFDRGDTGQFRGFVLSVLRMQTLLTAATGGDDTTNPVCMKLKHFCAGKPAEAVASTRNSGMTGPRSDGLLAVFPILFAGKTYNLIATPSALFQGPTSLLTGWIVLVMGLALTVVTASWVGVVFARRKQLVHLVEERTASLLESNLRYELVMEGASGGLFDWDTVNDRVYLSGGWKSMRGYDPHRTDDEDIDWKATIHPDDAPRFWATMDAHFDGETPVFEEKYRICCRDGAPKHVIGRGNSVRDAEGRVTRMAISEVDITAHRKMGETLDRERERLKNIISSSDVGTWEWNMETGETVINTRWAEIAGYTLEELSPVSFDTWTRLAHPDDLLLSNELAGRHFSGELDHYSCEVRMRHKNGDWIWVMDRGKVTRWNSDGKPLMMFGTHHDITVRKRAEEKLQENETNFRMFFSTMTDLTMVCSPEGGLLFVNDAVQTRLGYSSEELSALTVLDLHPDEHRVEAQAIFAAMLRGERECCPLPLAAKDGSYVPVETRVWVGKWNGRGCIFGMSKDLSKEQEAQQRFERLFRNNPALMALSSTEDRRLTDVNDSFLAATGYTREQVIGKTTAELGFFINPERHADAMSTLFATGHMSNVELEVRCKGGERLHGLFSAELIISQGRGHILSVMIDITRRKRTEERLRESEEIYRNQFARNTAVMLLVDPSDGTVIDANPAAQEFYGYSQERLRAMNISDINTLPEADLRKAMATVPSKKGALFNFQHRLADGSIRDVEVSSSSIPFSGRTVLHSIIHDVTQRIQTEHALRQTSARLSLAAKAGGVGIWDYYVVQNKLVWDDQMYRLYGITEDQFSGAYDAWQAGLHPDDRERGDEEIQSALRGEKDFDTEFRVIWPDGSIHSIRALALVYRDTSGKPLRLIGTNWDITDRKHAEMEIQRQASLITSLLDSIPDIIFFKDVDGVYLGCNPPFSEFSGRSRDEIIGNTDYDLFDKEIADFFRVKDREMLELLKPSHNEESITYPDGRTMQIDTLKTPYWAADGTLIGVLGISRDITVRKQAEEEIRRQASLIRSLLDSIPDLIFYKDLNGVYLGCNPPCAEFMGLSRDDVVGRTDYDLFGGEVADILHEQDLQVIESRRSIHNEDWFPRVDGTGVLFETLKTPYLAADGSLVGVLGVSRDITRRKQAEDALRNFNDSIALQVRKQVADNMALERALIHQSRLAAVGEMLNNIAHQWRQPLNALGIGLANLHDAHRHHELDDQLMAQSVETANRLIQKMSTTINDFRTFFQPNKELVAFSLREQIDAAVALVEPNFKSDKIAIHYIGDEDFICFGIPNEYSQVLLNLLLNAREAIVAHAQPQGLVEIEVLGTGADACVSVRDNGGGIPPDVLDRIFEPYFTTKPQGSGIGLYMSEMIVGRRMNGAIKVRNVPGGAEFTIVTPLQNRDDKNAKETQP